MDMNLITETCFHFGNASSCTLLRRMVSRL